MAEENDGTGDALTVTEAATVFAGLLSPESTSKATTPKAGEDTPPPEGDEDTEQTPTEDESEDEEKTDEEDETEPTPPPKTWKVKVAGAEHEVTEDELLKGYSRQEDYTRKTTELAEQRKVVATETDAVRAERAQYADHIAQVKKALADATPAEPDWQELARGDPKNYTATRQAWDEHKARISVVVAEEKRAMDAVEADRVKKQKEYIDDQTTKLFAKLPDWTQDDVRTKEQSELSTFAKSIGFNDADLAQVSDHRVVLLLRDAMLYQKGQAKKPDVSKKIADATVVAPGTGDKGKQKPEPGAEAHKRLAKTGHVRDAADLLINML